MLNINFVSTFLTQLQNLFNYYIIKKNIYNNFFYLLLKLIIYMSNLKFVYLFGEVESSTFYRETKFKFFIIFKILIIFLCYVLS